ncbi:MAG: DUF58 domain-containing protein [Anaerolineae bacterium]|nr:DUF58 domain-containing protein [Anaerolineae bacterium]
MDRYWRFRNGIVTENEKYASLDAAPDLGYYSRCKVAKNNQEFQTNVFQLNNLIPCPALIYSWHNAPKYKLMQLNIFKRKQKESTDPLFDERFLRRLESLSFRTAPVLRGVTLGEQRSRKLRPALDFSDHRAYVPGDDLRHIDWHIYAHHEELFVKLGEAAQSVNVHILLDSSRSMAWEPDTESYLEDAASPDNPAVLRRKRSKWNVARRMAGAMAYLALAGGERVNITAFGDTLGDSFGPTHGKQQVISSLRFLTSLKPVPPLLDPIGVKNGVGLAGSLRKYARVHSEGGLLILVSDLLDTICPSETFDEQQMGEELAEGLRHLTLPRWQVLVMHLLTTEEMRPTIEGDFDFRDIETSQNEPFYIDQKTLAQYRLRVRRWCNALEQICTRQGTTYSRILAEWPLEQKVMPFLRQRGVLR